MNSIINEYNKLYKDFDFSSVDISSIEKHILNVSGFANSTNICLAIYDSVLNKPIYMSESYKNYFHDESSHDELDSVHPDDYELVLRSTILALQYFNNIDKKSINDYILIRKYRAKIKKDYYVINEHIQSIEYDKNGKVWLALSIIEFSASQTPPYKFEFKLINNKTGEIISTLKNVPNNSLLSLQELEILRLIQNGLLSKEIAEKLSISVHTVNTHRQHILEKLNVNSSIEAIKSASSLGLL